MPEHSGMIKQKKKMLADTGRTTMLHIDSVSSIYGQTPLGAVTQSEKKVRKADIIHEVYCARLTN